jgi:hypothetical protein
MSENNGNSTFTKVLDTLYDSKIVDGLVEAGLAPRSLRIIRGTVTPRGANTAVLDARTGATITFQENDLIVAASCIATTNFATLTNLNLGLAATDGGAVSSVICLATALADLNAGGMTLYPAAVAAATAAQPAAVVVGSTNRFLSATATGTTETTGVLQVVIVVV